MVAGLTLKRASQILRRGCLYTPPKGMCEDGATEIRFIHPLEPFCRSRPLYTRAMPTNPCTLLRNKHGLYPGSISSKA
jgi:hypothetical protein